MEDEMLSKRIQIVYPLFGLKWCLILLNEFLPEYSFRKESADKHLDSKILQDIQLTKARNLFQKIKSQYQHFPYLT
jgi:hypothetical protein